MQTPYNKKEILEKVSNFLDNAYQLNDTICAIDIGKLYKFPNAKTYQQLTAFALLVKIEDVTLKISAKNNNQYIVYQPSYSFNSSHGINDECYKIFDCEYNIQRNGKFIYNQEQEIAKIKKIIETEAVKVNKYIAQLKSYCQPELYKNPNAWQKEKNDVAIKRVAVINDMCTSNAIRNILKKSDNANEQFNLLFEHINTTLMKLPKGRRYEAYERCGYDEYMDYLDVKPLYRILNALRCQIIINFNQ